MFSLCALPWQDMSLCTLLWYGYAKITLDFRSTAEFGMVGNFCYNNLCFNKSRWDWQFEEKSSYGRRGEQSSLFVTTVIQTPQWSEPKTSYETQRGSKLWGGGNPFDLSLSQLHLRSLLRNIAALLPKQNHSKKPTKLFIPWACLAIFKSCISSKWVTGPC